MTNLAKLNRDELNAEATRLGIEEPENLPNIAAAIEAIEGSDAAKADQAETPGMFIVNGIKVDYNGVPVKG